MSTFAVSHKSPVFIPACQIRLLSRRDLGDPERPGAGRRHGRNLEPVVAGLLERGGRSEQQINRHVGEIGHRPCRGDGDGEVVELLVAAHHGNAGARNRRARRLILRARAVEIAIEIPDHGIGVEVRAVMEFHAVAQMEDPDLGVLRSCSPSLGKPGTQRRQAVGPGQIPQHQPLENRVTEEAHPLKTVVGQPGWRGNVGRRHGDASASSRPSRIERPAKRQRARACR